MRFVLVSITGIDFLGVFIIGFGLASSAFRFALNALYIFINSAFLFLYSSIPIIDIILFLCLHWCILF